MHICCPCIPDDNPIIGEPGDPPRDLLLKPRTMRLQHANLSNSFTCRIPNEPFECDYGANPSSAHSVLGYQQTPRQDGDPAITGFGRDAICVRSKTQSGPTRTMILSGYNRYRYAGPFTAQAVANGCPVSPLLTSPGASGIKQVEEGLGRSYPLSDDVFAFPVWGSNSITGGTSDACVPYECIYNPNCFTGAAGGDNVGYLRDNGAGYTSFACFNPWGSWLPNDVINRTAIPSCSVYSMVVAVYDRMVRDTLSLFFGFYYTEDELVSDPYDVLNPPQGFAPVRSALLSVLSVDPSGALVNGVDPLMDKLYAYRDALNLFYSNNFGLPEAFVVPQVFLWDRTTYLAASATDRIKHLYVPGTLNVLMDTGCTHTNDEWKAFRCYVDEATHDMRPGSTHAAQVISFSGCNRNLSGSFSLSITNLGCALNFGTPDFPINPPIHDFCTLCADANSPWNMDPQTECLTNTQYEASVRSWCTCSGCD